MRRFTKSGTAWPKIVCLSAIEEELSIMNSRSILLTLLCLSPTSTRADTSGVAGATGRSRQPTPTTETDVSKREPTPAARNALSLLFFEIEVDGVSETFEGC